MVAESVGRLSPCSPSPTGTFIGQLQLLAFLPCGKHNFSRKELWNDHRKVISWSTWSRLLTKGLGLLIWGSKVEKLCMDRMGLLFWAILRGFRASVVCYIPLYSS